MRKGVEGKIDNAKNKRTAPDTETTQVDLKGIRLREQSQSQIKCWMIPFIHTLEILKIYIAMEREQVVVARGWSGDGGLVGAAAQGSFLGWQNSSVPGAVVTKN